MQVRAAVAYEAGKPLVIETVDLAGPREGEAPDPHSSSKHRADQGSIDSR